MPLAIPDLSLTQGQLLWALGHGREPSELLKDQLRYVRQLGIPRKSTQQAPGSGNRIRYDFYDLVEVGVAAKALELRFRPADIKPILVDHRREFHETIATAWRELPDAALTQPWVKSRGKVIAFVGDEIFVRLHDRRSERWGKLDLLMPSRLGEEMSPITMKEVFPDGEERPVIQLKQSMLPWVAWALEAPEPRRGPK